MERAGQVLGKLKLAKQGVSDEELARRPGLRLSAKKSPCVRGRCGLVRTRLVMEVEDAVWQRQLWTLQGQILQGIEQVLGRKVVDRTRVQDRRTEDETHSCRGAPAFGR